MNKVIDQRLLPDGEYVDAMNIRMGSTEKSEIGVIENTKGNLPLTTLVGPNNVPLSTSARCIGAIEDSANEALYWFVHDSNFSVGATGVCDLIVSFNVLTNTLTYHVISVDDGGGVQSTLNFNETYLITGVNIINDLLFFTDDYNPPRFINTNRNYANPIGLIDSIYAEQLLVIKKPPTQSPTVVPVASNGQENYMDTRFISFAYRYKYIDGEYSATSQWSQISFVPNPFEFSVNSMLNEGMTNACNTANITYNSGSKLVIGIDLLFKQSANNIIKVIEKLDKANLGLADDTEYTYIFSNSKIFTILNSSELLRLYDNVPRYAKAQTIMGNRLMYGNYIDGYNLIDKFGNPIKLEYGTTLITEAIGNATIPDRRASGNYSIQGPVTIVNAQGYIDLTGLPLVAGSSITVEITLGHSQFSGPTPYPTETTDEFDVEFTFFLINDYTSVYQMAISPEFQAAIGTSLPFGNIKPVYSGVPGVETSCDGTTFTDLVNCLIPNNLDAFQKITSGISFNGQAIYIIATPGSDEIGFQFPAMQFVSPAPPTAPTQTIYEYYTISFFNAFYQKISTPQSLHSNRGYEIGIVYMDEFNRASTALVSPNNTQYVPCAYSANKNSIQVQIPPAQRAPGWAHRYKFVIKPDTEFYETVYCNLFFTDPDTNEVWFFLEGENIKKVEVGDRLIVKSDTSGAVLTCAYATVLEKASKASGFIVPLQGVKVLAGVYMKINPNTFSAVVDPNATIAPGEISVNTIVSIDVSDYVILSYPMNLTRVVGYDPLNPTWAYEDYSVPAGSRIQVKWDWDRGGTGNNCEHRGYLFEKTFIASRNYDNMEDWWNGDHIESTLSSGVSKDGSTSLQYLPTNGILNTYDGNICYLQWYRDPTTNQLILQYSSGGSCPGFKQDGRRYYIHVANTVFRALDTIIFETEPSDASPDIFFENNLSFAIDVDGNHSGNVQNQTFSQPAIVDTEFFNCFAFGNGAESYKIRDSIIGRYFTLGERVTTVSAQDYKEADRFADISYSGVYNAETNVNKLNEFNLGLLDYKNLETSFGPIFIMDGRETDVLVLQEDKISYVLAGKNLISDSAAGGVIVSVPEVLGTQIARVENYGISFNPESYVQWGYNRYFTDIKRGAVLNIKGDSMQQDQLVVISEANMRTWFRDEFNQSFNTQKLGGYDPYMNEYVLSTNDRLIPANELCLECGISQTLSLKNESPFEEKSFKYCVNLGPLIGDSTITWNVVSNSGDPFNIIVTYDGNTFESGLTTISGQFDFPKNNILEIIAQIEIAYTSATLLIDVLIDCPVAEPLTIIEVVLTNNEEVGDSSHIQYRYTNGSYVGPLISRGVTFVAGTSPVVSLYNLTTGFAGSGGFPPEFSVMTMQSNSIIPDNFVFNPINDEFKWLRGNTLYPNTTVGINALIAASTIATPIAGSGSLYSSTFIVPAKTVGSYLYLIWDYRDLLPLQLCYASTEFENPRVEVCCNCKACTTLCVTVSIYNPLDIMAEVLFPSGDDWCTGFPIAGPLSVEIPPFETVVICVNNDFIDENVWQIITGLAIVTITSCECLVPCLENCSQWYYINDSESDAQLSATNCEDCSVIGVFDIPAQSIRYIDACINTIPIMIKGDEVGLVLTKYCGVCAKSDPFCVYWEIYDIARDFILSWRGCNSETTESISLTTGTVTWTICVQYPFIPDIGAPGTAKRRIVGNGCNCFPL
jgi:hypothetical protein